MKKGMAFIAVIVFLLALNYEKLFSLFEKNDVNVLAKVNGEEITLEEVEILYDMRNVHLNTPAPDVDRVQQEYAEILYNRIKQVLVSQELEKRNVAVTDEEVLLTAAGHLEGSSLPVGGEGTHAVISAHRGLPSAALFTDLDRLEEVEEKE